MGSRGLDECEHWGPSQSPPGSVPTPVNCKCTLPSQSGHFTALHGVLLGFQERLYSQLLISHSLDVTAGPAGFVASQPTPSLTQGT